MDLSANEDVEREVAQDFESILRGDILSLTVLPTDVLKLVCELLEGAKVMGT